MIPGRIASSPSFTAATPSDEEEKPRVTFQEPQRPGGGTAPQRFPTVTEKQRQAARFPGGQVLQTGKELHPNQGPHVADLQTARSQQALIAGGNAAAGGLQQTTIVGLLEQLNPGLANAAAGKLAVLTQPLRFHCSPAGIQTLPASPQPFDRWLAQHDRPGNFLVLNGNNDESYVSFIAQRLKHSQHLQFITSGFGGHGTTDRHPVRTEQTEAGRFSAILRQQGIDSHRIHADPWSVNSGQNASNVASILNQQMAKGAEVNEVIIAGTPAAVFRQTLTYARQLPLDRQQPWQVSAFPFHDAQQRLTAADNLALLREFSTTLHYMASTDYLPAQREQLPAAFFAAAKDSIQQSAATLRGHSSLVAEKYRTTLDAMDKVDDDLLARLKDNTASKADKQILRDVDGFFRGLFNALEAGFPRQRG